MDCQDVLDYVRVAMNDNEAIEAHKAFRDAKDAAEAEAEAADAANYKTPKKPRMSIADITAQAAFSTPESARRTGKALKRLESQWKETYDSAKTGGHVKKAAMAMRKLDEVGLSCWGRGCSRACACYLRAEWLVRWDMFCTVTLLRQFAHHHSSRCLVTPHPAPLAADPVDPRGQDAPPVRGPNASVTAQA